MAKPRRDWLERAHVMAWSWAEWTVTHVECSAIGYPSRTGEARLAEDGGQGGAVARCVVPDVVMPHHVAVVDRAVKVMPQKLRETLEQKYLHGGEVARRSLTEALTWLSGAVGIASGQPGLQLRANFLYSSLTSGTVTRVDGEPAAAEG